MAKYKRKTYVIEAFQITEVSTRDPGSWPGWLKESWRKTKYGHDSLWASDGDLFLCHGGYIKKINLDDWIIKGEFGGLNNYSPGYFDENYEVIKEK
jgi:hypothetical protein